LPGLSLKTKMTAAVSMLTAALLSILAFSAQLYFVSQIKGVVSNQQFTMVSAIAEQIDNQLQVSQNELIAAADKLGKISVVDPVLIGTFLADRPDTVAIFDNGLFLFSAQGDFISGNPVDPQLVGKNFAHRDYMKRTLATGKPQISEPFISAQSHHHPIIMFTAPIFDQKGTIAAVLAGSFDLTKNNFIGKLASTKVGERGYFYLYTESRLMVMHRDRERVMTRDVAPGVNLLYDKAIAGFEGAGETVTSRKLAAISSFKRLKTTGWILACNLPQSEAYAPAHRVQRYLLMAALVVFAASFLVVWFCMERLTAPLLSFTRQIRALTSRESQQTRVTVETNDEIGELGEAFNQLLSELEDQKREIKKQLDFSQILIDSTPVPIFYKDADGKYLGCNKSFEEFTGFDRADMIGKCVFDIAPSREAEIYHQADRDLALSGGFQVYETAVVDAGGARHEVVFFKTSFPGADGGNGGNGGIVGVMLDITERKLAEYAHEKVRRQLQLILDAAGEGIYGLDREGRVTFVNPAAAQMVGWEQEELLGQHQHTLMHCTRADGSAHACEQCTVYASFHDGQSHQGKDEVFWRKDGTSFPVEYISTPLVENGELVGAVVIYRDTTERNQAEEQLLKLSQAVMQSPVAIAITDCSGNIEFVNPKFTELSGYQAEEMVGQNPRLLKGGRTPNEVYQNLWSTISAGRVWSGEIYNRRKDDQTYWVHATISPIRNSAGTTSHYMAFMESMTERKRLEEQLRQAQKMEAIGQLAGGVAHDFNNILTVIMGFGQMMQFSLQPDDPKRTHMDQILDAADRAAHLTKSLLAFSRKQVMLLAQLDLNELARKHTTFLVRIIGEDITLKTSFCQDPLPVLADGGQIEQVLMNLATNARDAMPGGGELSISSETVQLGKEFYQQYGYGTPGRYALITVTDTGAGMDPEIRDKIFEPFFTTKEPGRGTGLGLSIVYGIVKQHGGYITIHSQRGLGTTFSIYLPLATGRGEVVEKTPTLAPQGGKETILVVEDDPAVRRLVESVLKRYGYSVILAEDGVEAVAAFESKWQEIDLALLDVIMPKMNGKEVCEKLRQRVPRLKVLFLSGYTADLIQDKGIRVEGIDIIAKPAKPLELARKIREMLDAA